MKNVVAVSLYGIRICVENPLTLLTVVAVVNIDTVHAHTVVCVILVPLLFLSLCETPIVTLVNITMPKIVAFVPPRDANADALHLLIRW